MIRQRFRGGRTTRIVAWTLACLTWAAALTARLVGIPADGGEVLAEDVMPDTVDALSQAAASAMPAMPDDGLVLIRSTPAPRQEPPVVRRVIVQGGRVAAPPSGGGGGGAGGGGTTTKKKKVPTSGS